MPEAATAQAQVTEPSHKPRLRFAIDAIEESIGVAKSVGKRSSDAAEEFMDDTMQRIRRHPVETVVMAFSAGFILGGFLCWMSGRK